jgi:hypothetical protein
MDQQLDIGGYASCEGAPTAVSARGLPAGSTAGPGSFVRDSFGSGMPVGHTAGLPAGGAPSAPKGDQSKYHPRLVKWSLLDATL